MASQQALSRSESDRILGGVCGGLAVALGVDATVVRVAFVVMTIFGAAGLVLYVALWVVLPTESRAGAAGAETVREGLDEIRAKLRLGRR